ncbi:MAG: cell division protein FtsQ/DivIB [bacterium]
MKKYTKKKPAKRSAAYRGPMEGAGAFVDEFLQNAVQMIIRYTTIAASAALIIFVLMLFAGGYFFNIGGRVNNLARTMAKASGYEIDRVSMKGGHQTPTAEIINALYDSKRGNVIGQSILHYDAKAAQKKIEEIGWVKHAAVARLWPNTIHISVQERVPAALWQSKVDGALYLVDESGAQITEVGGHQYTGLPVIMNASSPRAAAPIMTELRRYPEVSRRIAALRQQGNRRWDVIFRNDFVVKLPERDVEQAIERMVKLEKMPGTKLDNLEYLDLRNAKSAFYKPRNG